MRSVEEQLAQILRQRARTLDQSLLEQPTLLGTPLGQGSLQLARAWLDSWADLCLRERLAGRPKEGLELLSELSATETPTQPTSPKRAVLDSEWVP